MPCSELESKFNANAHPRVVTREKHAATVAADFHNGIACYAKGGNLDKAGFYEYYMDVNATLPAEKENYFQQLLSATWGISTSGKSSHGAGSRIAELEDLLFEKIRQRTHGADDEGKTARKYFKHFDLDGYGTLQFGEFCKALESLGCVMREADARSLFNHYDASGDGKLDYEEFAAIFAMKGTGNNPNVNPSFGIKREPPNQVL